MTLLAHIGTLRDEQAPLVVYRQAPVVPVVAPPPGERRAAVLRKVEEGFSTSGDIAKATGLEQTTTSALLNQLWKLGKINRYEITNHQGRWAWAYEGKETNPPQSGP